ncbi:hypothetical protein V1514DRAFT_330548 [Lipomyces japonicus]|uniref:uncharacterized protein n=1 Tax=Lipomyces japonicus TaxID=56871 RepID=UPI0034CD5321
MADSRISYSDALAYWASVPATVDGVLGGFGHTSLPRTDARGSLAFFNRVVAASSSSTPSSKRACDIGAGIGRVSRDVLVNVADTIDLVEPVPAFADRIPAELAAVGHAGKLGRLFVIGMQDFTPDPGAYWFMWCQWCLGQLTDDHLVQFLRRCARGLQPGGFMFVKENNSTSGAGQNDEFDSTDSSVTRSDVSFRRIFAAAGFDLVASELQLGLPQGLYPVRTYALAPTINNHEDQESLS